MRDEALMIPMAGISLPLILVPIILGFRQVAKKREFQHRERMKALETGQAVPGESNWPQAFVCAAIGAGVPIGSFLFTFLAWICKSASPGEIWVAPAVVSLVAVISSASLGSSMFASDKSKSKAEAELNGKPAFDPDAYDVVGSRG
jgi:hypothetical protein